MAKILEYYLERGKFSDFPREDQIKMRRLNFGNSGMMLERVINYPTTQVVCAFDEKRMLLGWVLYEKEFNHIMIYVRKRFRKMGIGRELVFEMLKRKRNIEVYISDNYGFYKKLFNENHRLRERAY